MRRVTLCSMVLVLLIATLALVSNVRSDTEREMVVEAFLTAARGHLADKNYPRALELGTKALEKSPKNEEALLLVGEVQFLQGNARNAGETLLKALSLVESRRSNDPKEEKERMARQKRAEDSLQQWCPRALRLYRMRQPLQAGIEKEKLLAAQRKDKDTLRMLDAMDAELQKDYHKAASTAKSATPRMPAPAAPKKH